MLPRLITSQVQGALRRQAAVALLVPRQVGNTTLALQIGEASDALYLDLEDSDDRSRLDNLSHYFARDDDRAPAMTST